MDKSENKKFMDEWNYFVSKINFNKSAMDAKAIDFMNTFQQKLENTRFKIWLIWDVDITNKDTSLVAITLSKEKADKYESSLKERHKQYENKQFFVDVEERICNHLFGGSVLETIGMELKKNGKRKRVIQNVGND